MRTRLLPLALASFCAAGIAQAAPDRLAGPIDSSATKTLRGYVNPKVRGAADLGLADAALPIRGAMLLLKPAPGVEAFTLEQQTPGSPNYQKWLTPEQFAERFGVSGNDTAKIVAWLEAQGLQVNAVARGRQFISFRGTAGSIGKAFHTEIHRYNVDGKVHFANATEPSIPAALDSVVAGFHGLSDFTLQPMLRQAMNPPDYNSSTGRHYLAPDDVATIYDIAPLYAAGTDGTGQTIAIVGQTDVNLADIRAFRTKFNLPAKDPQIMLFGDDPGVSAGDLPEADLDIEWSGAVAKNATIVFVNSNNVVTSLFSAIDNAVAPVISMSYGGCETENTPDFRIAGQQANAEGITFVVSSGDSGAAACDFSTPTPQATKGLSVNFPASFPEVTAVGGTTFSEGTGNYWSAGNGPNLGSVLSYIPETAWNDTVERNQLAATGGGFSYFYPKPYWQSVAGVPADGARDLPDVAFAASPDHDGYLVETGGGLFVYGGTSVGTPVFAGMLALLNQSLTAKNVIAQPGLGNVNPALYRLAQASTDVFHDVTTGGNVEPCAQSSPNCVNGSLGYSAGANYDLATGLGSVDAYHMVKEWNVGLTSTSALTAAPANANLNDTVTLSATVTSAGTATPTGTVTFLSSFNSLGTVNLTPGPGGTATATLAVNMVRIAEGTGAVSAIYSGDGVVGGSGASAFVNLIIPPSGSLVVPSIDPNPVYQFGNVYIFSVTLQEVAGVTTKLTGFSVDGSSLPLSFFPSTNLAAFGVLQTTLESGVSLPVTAGIHVFSFTGADKTGGKTWSESVTATFLPSNAPATNPSILLTSVPSTVFQNPSAPASCQWSQQLQVQEQGGFLTNLTQLSVGSTNMNSQIQQIFGTTRLAPWGTLYGTLCYSASTVSASKTFTLGGVGEIGDVSSVATVAYTLPPPAAATFSVSVPSIVLGGAAPFRNAQISVNLTGGDSVWTATVFPANPATQWLSVTPGSGQGPTQITLQAATVGLSKGVYQAYVTFQTTNAFPQAINVPVTLVVGGSNTLSISTISNAASARASGAPGAQMLVYGLNLAPSSQAAASVPLPLNLAGVSATVNGVAVPLYSVGPGQVVLQVPYETAPGTAVVAINNNGQIAWQQFPVAIAAPGLFQTTNGFLVPSSTGQIGQSSTLYITGDGDVTPTLTTGASPSSGTATKNLPHPRLPVAVTVGGTQAVIGFVGIPPGLVGVTQINFTPAPGTPTGLQPVVVSVGGISSQAVNMTVAAGM